MDTVIEIKHLEKHFGDLRVLNDINFRKLYDWTDQGIKEV